MDETVDYEWGAIDDGVLLETDDDREYLESEYPNAEILKLPKPHMSFFI